MRLYKRTLSAIIFTFLLTSCSQAPQAKSGGPAFPAVPVTIGQAAEQVVPIQVQSIGNVQAFSTVEVKAQVAGPVVAVKFAEGTIVKQGNPLFEIDTRPFREALRQAEASVAKDEAQLRVAEANLARSSAQLKNAKSESARFEQLSKEGISTRQQEDQVKTNAEVAEHSASADEATIESIRATLESDRAAVEQAKLNVEYCNIRAPITGRAGTLMVHAGNLVKANGDTPMVVINQISPVFVLFGVPERFLSTIAFQRVQQKLAVDAAPDKNSDQAAHGTLAVIDNAVDPNTGAIRLKAVFDNKDGRLWPGQFVNVSITLEKRSAVLVRSEAVQAGQNGPFLYVVKQDQSVEPRPVVVGQTVRDSVIIEKGLAAGETVVTDGQSRLFPGAKVKSVSNPNEQPAKL
jgi:multidrug efflux system membrane fusion protein